MSMETRSKLNNRVYRRVFDHDQARELHAKGWSYQKLSELFGVSVVAVNRVCDPRLREKMDKKANDFLWKHRPPCKRCGKLCWAHIGKRTGYCHDCFNEVQTLPDVRPDELRCKKCGEWKPDGEFYREKRKTRRGRKAWCRGCDNEARQEHRRRHRDQERATSRRYKRRTPRKKGSHRVTNFTVMQLNGDGEWREIGKVNAGSRLHAVENLVTEAGTYIAVSANQMKTLLVEPMMNLRVISGREKTD